MFEDALDLLDFLPCWVVQNPAEGFYRKAVAEGGLVSEGFAAALRARRHGIKRRQVPREGRAAFVEMLLRARERREMSGNY